MNFIKSLVLGLSLSLASLAAFAAQINLNTASAAQLETLNGIGAAKAEAIVEYRKEHGAFKSVDELAQVKGIGQKTVDKNRDQMTVAAK
jgi:competence protein ComEA